MFLGSFRVEEIQ